MDIYADTLATANWDMSANVDLASATTDVFLAGAWHGATWAGAATVSSGTWTRVATLLVSGANPLTGIKPTSADHQPLTRLTVGGQVVPTESDLRFDLR